MRISDWSSDVCSSDLTLRRREEALSEVTGATLDVDAAACVPTAAQPGSAAELVELLRDGIEAGCVTRRGAKLILFHRVLGTPTHEVEIGRAHVNSSH